MKNETAIYYPLIKAEFIDHYLNGTIFNPLINHHYCDLWLGYYVSNILSYDCTQNSNYFILNKPHNNITNYRTNIFDTIIYNCLAEICPTNYNYNNINFQLFCSIGKKLKLKYDLYHIYEKYLYRFCLVNKLSLSQRNYKRDIEISFIIANKRPKNETQLDKIISEIHNFNTTSYEILIFSNIVEYNLPNVSVFYEEDYGSTWAYNRLYQESKGKNIIVLTDYSIPTKSILNFTQSNKSIDTSRNIYRIKKREKNAQNLYKSSVR